MPGPSMGIRTPVWEPRILRSPSTERDCPTVRLEIRPPSFALPKRLALRGGCGENSADVPVKRLCSPRSHSISPHKLACDGGRAPQVLGLGTQPSFPNGRHILAAWLLLWPTSRPRKQEILHASRSHDRGGSTAEFMARPPGTAVVAKAPTLLTRMAECADGAQ